MTLLISGCSAVHAFQASDRLLSRGKTSFDPESNKTIILSLRDSLISLSYSGPAYIDHVPTDQWIVQTIAGVTLIPFFDGSPATCVGINRLAANSSKVGGVLLDLGAALNAALSTQQSHPLCIVAVGFQWKDAQRRRWRPVGYVLEKRIGARPRIHNSRPRFFPRDQWRLLYAPLGYVPKHESDGLISDGAKFTNPDHWAYRVCEIVRSVAGRHPTYVGRDVMYVRIPPPPHRVVDVLFCADPNRPEPVKLDGHPAICSPWIVDGFQIFPPARVVGVWHIRLRDCIVRLGIRPSPEFASFHAQVRKKDPLR